MRASKQRPTFLRAPVLSTVMLATGPLPALLGPALLLTTLLLVGFVLAPAHVLAQGPADPLFTVRGIEVDASAENAVAARAAAVDQAQREGLRRLLRRLTLEQYHNGLPSLTQGNVQRYVHGFEVESEQVASNRYVATLAVSYKGDEIQELIKGTGVPIVLGRSDPLLVVPALATGAGYDIWSEDNPWRAAWGRIADEAAFLDVRLPLGDLRDISILPPEDVGNAEEALSGLAELYGTEQALVVIAEPQDSGRPPERLLVTTADRLGWSWPLSREIVETGGGSVEEGWNEAVRETLSLLNEQWKPDNLVRYDRVSELAVSVPLDDLAQWAELRQRLEGLLEIREVAIDAFSRAQADLTIAHIGSTAQLERSMRANGLDLSDTRAGLDLTRDALPLGESNMSERRILRLQGGA